MTKYSIILPMCNGGEYVKLCVNSILSQTLNNFNLIVLDNNSSDGSREWLLRLNDPRIIVHSSDKSLTIEENWGRVSGIAKNEFITLIGHDDILDPHYLQIMDDLINKYPDASLYQCHFNFIDSNGNNIRDCREMKEKEPADEFLNNILIAGFDIVGTGFMMRSKTYDDINGIPDYPGLLFADYELWLNLTLPAYKATSARHGFSFRLHSSATTTSSDIKYQNAFERFVQYLHSLQQSSVSLKRIIDENAEAFLLTQCKAICHRLLRTDRSGNTSAPSVTNVLQNFERYAELLIPGRQFQPSKLWSVKAAMVLDKYAAGRKLFLFFKKLFPKPVLK